MESYSGGVPLAVGFVVLICALAVVLWLSWSTRQDLMQLRRELDESQRHVNDLRSGLSELRADMSGLRGDMTEVKAAAEAVASAPPPLPRARSSGLDDLREQLRAAHREESSDSE